MIWLDIWKVCFASYPLLKHNICLNYILTVKQLSRYNYYMKHQQAAPKFFPKKRCIILSVIALLLIVPITVITQPKIADKLSSLINSTSFDRSPGESAFPDIDTANLSPTRQKIISLAKTEFKAQSAGTKFSQGAEEAWCANFVSWIMHHKRARRWKTRTPAAGAYRGRLPCASITKQPVASSLLIPAINRFLATWQFTAIRQCLATTLT